MIPNGLQFGEPYDFGKMMDTVMISRCIVSDASLLPGARLLWGIIRQRMYNGQPCSASDLTLAKELGVTPRAIRKYDFQLRNAGLLKTIARPGGTTLRVLLLANRFRGTVNMHGPEQAFQGGGTSVPGGRNNRARAYKEDGALRFSLGQSKAKVQDNSGVELRKPGVVNGDFTRQKAHTFDADEHEAIVRGIVELGLKPTPALLTRLARQAGTFNVNGYRIAAIIARAAALVRRKPSLRPESAAWVSAVVESELAEKAAKGQVKSAVPSMKTAADLLKSAGVV